MGSDFCDMDYVKDLGERTQCCFLLPLVHLQFPLQQFAKSKFRAPLSKSGICQSIETHYKDMDGILNVSFPKL